MADLKTTVVNGDLFVNGDIYNLNNESLSEKIDNEYDKIINMICSSTELAVTATPGTNYTINEATAILVGTTLRLYLYVDRSSAVDGNISNELIATFKITDNGKCRNFYNVASGTRAYGPVCSIYTGGLSRIDDNTINIDIYLAATGGAMSNLDTYVCIPVALQESAF